VAGYQVVASGAEILLAIHKRLQALGSSASKEYKGEEKNFERTWLRFH